MVSPTNLDFQTPGPAPGTAAGWATNINNAGVVIADFRGTLANPVGYDDFSHDWGTTGGDFPSWSTGTSFRRGDFSTAHGNVYEALNAGTSSATGTGPTGTSTFVDNTGPSQITWQFVRVPIAPVYSPTNQAWSSTIQIPSAASFGRPARPAGGPYEDFSFRWSNFGSTPTGADMPFKMFAGATDPQWPAPATGFCDRYLTAIDTADQGEFCSASPAGPNPPPPRAFEDFGAGWTNVGLVPPTGTSSNPIPISGSTGTPGTPIHVTLAAGHGVESDPTRLPGSVTYPQKFPIFIHSRAGDPAENGLWELDLSASATSATVCTLPGTTNGLHPPGGVATVEVAFETNLVPPSWALNTGYDVGDVVVANGAWWSYVATRGVATSAGAAPFALADGWTLIVSIDTGPFPVPGQILTIPFAAAAVADITAVTAVEFVTVLASFFSARGVGATASFDTVGHVSITTDTEGSAGDVNIIGGRVATATAFPTGDTPGADAATGTSSATGTGPTGTSTFVDNPGPSQITWQFVRATPTPIIYATTAAEFATSSTPAAFEDFSSGWANDAYRTQGADDGAFASHGVYAPNSLVSNDTTPVKVYITRVGGTDSGSTGPTGTGSSIVVGGITWAYVGVSFVRSTASFHGLAATAAGFPDAVAVDNIAYEDFNLAFFPGPKNVVPIAIVDTVNNVVGLAPGYSLLDGARVVFAATPPYAAYGATYPTPIVPGVGYVTWATVRMPTLGLNWMSIGDPTLATRVLISSSTNTFPIVVTTTTPHGLNAGDVVLIYDHTLNVSLDGIQVVAASPAPTPTTFAVTGTAPTAAGGATGVAYGPITLVTLTTTGGAAMTLVFDPTYGWNVPG